MITSWFGEVLKINNLVSGGQKVGVVLKLHDLHVPYEARSGFPKVVNGATSCRLYI
jgi:hypothetical protein